MGRTVTRDGGRTNSAYMERRLCVARHRTRVNLTGRERVRKLTCAGGSRGGIRQRRPLRVSRRLPSTNSTARSLSQLTLLTEKHARRPVIGGTLHVAQWLPCNSSPLHQGKPQNNALQNLLRRLMRAVRSEGSADFCLSLGVCEISFGSRGQRQYVAEILGTSSSDGLSGWGTCGRSHQGRW
jgi:hypothetical protein